MLVATFITTTLAVAVTALGAPADANKTAADAPGIHVMLSGKMVKTGSIRPVGLSHRLFDNPCKTVDRCRVGKWCYDTNYGTNVHASDPKNATTAPGKVCVSVTNVKVSEGKDDKDTSAAWATAIDGIAEAIYQATDVVEKDGYAKEGDHIMPSKIDVLYASESGSSVRMSLGFEGEAADGDANQCTGLNRLKDRVSKDDSITKSKSATKRQVATGNDVFPFQIASWVSACPAFQSKTWPQGLNF